MKAVYTKIGPKYYQVKQSPCIPTSMSFVKSGASSNVTIDMARGEVKQNISISNMPTVDVKTNAQLIKEMKEYLEEHQITEIDTIQDYYKICIEYRLFYGDKGCNEVSQVIKPVCSKDKVHILGVATNNELVYRQVKTFNPTVDFNLRVPLPHGICDCSVGKVTLMIDNISIYQSINDFCECHNSLYEVSCCNPSQTVNAQIQNDLLIYSTRLNGICITPVELTFVPRRIEVLFNLVLSDYIIAYDDITINAVLIENLEKKYAPEVNPEVDDPDLDDNNIPDVDQILIPEGESNKIADGKYEPDEQGYYDWYERCNGTTPKALLVVEDLLSDALYDNAKMIHKYMVIADIPDIQVGEFVIYRESVENEFHPCPDNSSGTNG